MPPRGRRPKLAVLPGEKLAAAAPDPSPADPADAELPPPGVTVEGAEVFGPSQDPRRRTVEVLRERIERRLQPVADLELWNGVFVVTRADLAEAFLVPLPPPASTTASVRTPAFVYVDAICPRCYQPGEILVTFKPQLTVAPDHTAELRVKAKAAPLPHVCGQARLDDAGAVPVPPVKGQLALAEPEPAPFDASGDSVAPDPADAPAVDRLGLELGACPFAGCVLAAEHPGAHTLVEVGAPDAGDDLLPWH